MKKALLFVLLVGSVLISKGQGWLDKAVLDGRVDSVWQGIDLPQAFTGEGVIVGVVDWGFDYTHPVFYDTTLTNYRVLRAWDQFKNSGPAPTGFHYGTEYTGREQLLLAQCDTSNCYDYNYHGTHCASIAAGGDTKYRGVACGANLLFASLYLDSISRVIDAWNWMYEVAQQEGKRLVISNSWGLYYMDNMDGTGQLAQEMQRLSDLGVVFTVSAGNNGDVNFHVQYDFEHAGDTMRTQFQFPNYSATLWGSSITMMNSENAPFEFAVQIMDNAYQELTTTPFVATHNNEGYVDTFVVVNNDTIFFNYEVQSCNVYNQAPVVRLRVKRTSNFKFALVVTASTGTFHAWNLAEVTKAYGNWGANFVAPPQFPTWIAGDNRYGISTPGNVDCAITVAAHVKRVKNMAGYYVGGKIADFSSAGPGFHDVRKPEVSAPGQNIVAAINSYTTTYTGSYSRKIEFNGRMYGFGPLSGTSMSCPFVAGVVALLLQVNPYLTSSQIKEIITQTAYNDQFTEEYGIERFGCGKVDAYAAVQAALQMTGVEDHTYALESRFVIFPNPASKGCTLTAQTDNEYVGCKIMDMTGRVVQSERIFPGVNSVNLENLAKGCYVIRLQDGNTIITKKLLVQ